ncbi:MAG: hypothetical protein H7343_00790, partial [Undibacterium sp.]|nr:hypothetical protein [Opitutaceae bacterium]
MSETPNPKSETRNPERGGARHFRTRLLLAFMLMVGGITALVLLLAERNLATTVARDFERAFADELSALQRVQQLRHAALAERCRALVRKSRIHAALEDGALDLLYPSAADELRDIMVAADAASSAGLHAEFYRFLDRTGAVIPPPPSAAVGALTPVESAQLVLPRVPPAPQLGYIARPAPADAPFEIITTPIVSTETGEVIAALVHGFKPFAVVAPGHTRGLFLGGRLH